VLVPTSLSSNVLLIGTTTPSTTISLLLQAADGFASAAFGSTGLPAPSAISIFPALSANSKPIALALALRLLALRLLPIRLLTVLYFMFFSQKTSNILHGSKKANQKQPPICDWK
jgi:hypothetical protein